MTALWDRLPLPLQHLVVLFAATFGGSLVQDITGAGGVTGVAWHAALVAALNAAAVATASGAALLWLSPATRTYGLFQRHPVEDPKHAAA